MKNKVKYFKGITILSIFSLISVIASAACFAGALDAIKSHPAGFFAGMFILILFILLLALSAVLAFIALPLTIISIRYSEKKVYPIVIVSIQSLIVITGIILTILLVTR